MAILQVCKSKRRLIQGDEGRGRFFEQVYIGKGGFGSLRERDGVSLVHGGEWKIHVLKCL